MKKQYLYLMIAGLFLFAAGCEKNDTKFEDIALDVTAEEEAVGEFLLGGWAGEENEEEFYQDLYGFGNGNLPPAVDLTHLLPPVGHQGTTGTCVAWAAGYYIKTALNAQDANLSPGELRNPARQYSPKDLFWSLPINLKGPNCQGTHFEHALDMMAARGVATMATVPFQDLGDCSAQPHPSWTAEAAGNCIESHRNLPVDVAVLKEKLAEGRPLMWAAHVTRSFLYWRGPGVMTEAAILDGTNGPGTGHAMAIVGYDDARGAFRMVNSWGTEWGDGGFAWVSYGLLANRSFTDYVFVAYNKPGSAEPEPGGNPASGTDLAIKVLKDEDDPNHPDPRHRVLTFDIANLGPDDVDAWDGWSNVYIFFNARNAHDHGAILHQYITDWIGDEGEFGPLQDGVGGWASYWFNVALDGREELADAFFRQETEFAWPYRTPDLTGEYYLALITDAFAEVEESNESNNILLITGENGRPIWFSGGIGHGRSAGPVDMRSSERDPNAYTPEEICRFIANLKASGKLKKMVDEASANAQPPASMK
ncbi:MAG: hypothetical protein KDD10_22725 [Phaeodactylibacter sp.]|nr:hypothetical protein [Phaeodactylibacter sp.]MCB9292934.1 hypothetical protein [Lewinellaceae bacterium]